MLSGEAGRPRWAGEAVAIGTADRFDPRRQPIKVDQTYQLSQLDPAEPLLLDRLHREASSCSGSDEPIGVLNVVTCEIATIIAYGFDPQVGRCRGHRTTVERSCQSHRGNGMAAQSSRRTKHRAELYRFEVTPEYRSSRAPLWRLNSTGLTARELIQAALDELDATNRDESIRLRHMEPLADLGDDEAGAVLGRGRSGVSSEIWETDRLALRRQPEHVETVSAVVICSLRDHYTGLVAMHVPHNMPYKSVLADWLESQFAAHGLDLRMWPVTDYGAWAEAISNGYVKKMRLRARDEASVPLSTSYAQEMGGDLGGVDLVFRARRGGFLRPLPLLRYMQRQGAADRTAVLEFQELLFEEADVTVKPPGGMERTYLLDGGEGGSPLSQYLDVNLDDSRHLGHPREAEESDDQRERRNVAIQGIVTQIREMIEQAPRTST